MVDHVQHVAGVVEPGGVVADFGGVEDAGVALVGGIGDPDGADAEAVGLC